MSEANKFSFEATVNTIQASSESRRTDDARPIEINVVMLTAVNSECQLRAKCPIAFANKLRPHGRVRITIEHIDAPAGEAKGEKEHGIT